MTQNKWVDRYLLRYGPATIFGAFLLAYFYLKRRQLGFDFNLGVDRLGLATIFLFGGFLFAYIASAPILVYHYSRCLFLPRKNQKKAVAWSVVIMIVGTPIVTWRFIHGGVDVSVAIFAALAYTLWLTVVRLAFVCYVCRNEVQDFYVRLAKMRKETDPELVESYRTLREHGNAFYIIFWEIVLALVLFAFLQVYTVSDEQGMTAFSLIICLTWIAPAAVAWHIAGNLEADLVDRANQT